MLSWWCCWLTRGAIAGWTPHQRWSSSSDGDWRYACVEHHGRPQRSLILRVAVAVGVEQGGVAGGELVQNGGELGDVGTFAGVDVAGNGDGAVTGHHQGQADQSQVAVFLFGLSALGDRGPVVGGVDERREVRHVQCQPGQTSKPNSVTIAVAIAASAAASLAVSRASIAS